MSRTSVSLTDAGYTFTPYSGFTLLNSFSQRFGPLTVVNVEVTSSTTHAVGQVSVGKWNTSNATGLGAARVGPSTLPTGYPAVCQLAANGEMRFYTNNNADKFWGVAWAMVG